MVAYLLAVDRRIGMFESAGLGCQIVAMMQAAKACLRYNLPPIPGFFPGKRLAGVSFASAGCVRSFI
jgi:hypothetical protein